MSKAGKRIIKGARAAVKFSRLLSQFNMKDESGAVTVFVSKKGKVHGVVHGQRYRGKVPRP